MKKLILLLATIGCLQNMAHALVQGTIKPAPANSFTITIRNSDPGTITGNFAQYNAAIRVAQTVPQPTLTLTNLLPVGSVTVNLTYSSGGYTYYNIVFEAGTSVSNPVSLAQNVELDIFSGTFSNGSGSAQVDLVDTWMFTDPTGLTHTGTGISQFTQFYVNIDPSGPSGDATNYSARFYTNAQSTTAVNAAATSFVGLASVPLPVNFSHIEVSKNNSNAVLTWGTAIESNNAGFYIERSNDGKMFNSVGYVASKAVNGNSNEAQEYAFTDNRPLAGVNYYRLKQMSKDGQTLYSTIVNVAFENSQTVKIYPNPAIDRITVEAAAVKSITLYNLLGQAVHAPVNYGSSSHNVITSGLAKGSYSVRILTENGTITQKLILQ
jgi:hypothetical protein